MSPDDLLWTAISRGGLTSDDWELVVDHLTKQLGFFLGFELARGDDASIDPGKSLGFSVDFWTPMSVALPLGLRVRGTFGASQFNTSDSTYIGVQGWLYSYIDGYRVATTANRHNHLFMRYAKTDADDDDWEMLGCTDDSSWRSLGWSPDTYDEFDGLDYWSDGRTV